MLCAPERRLRTTDNVPIQIWIRFTKSGASMLNYFVHTIFVLFGFGIPILMRIRTVWQSLDWIEAIGYIDDCYIRAVWDDYTPHVDVSYVVSERKIEAKQLKKGGMSVNEFPPGSDIN
jgi:hypothetical protein